MSLVPRFLIVAALLAPVAARAADPPRPERRAGQRREHTPHMSYLDNRTVSVGVDLALGGAITYLSPSSKERNVINSHDWGRQAQMSYYAGPVPFSVEGKHPPAHWKHLGWNPVQSGDDYGNRSRVLAHRNDGKEIYVKCVPMQWPLDDVPGECTFETWLRLDGPAVRVRCRLLMNRLDRTPYRARTQELPAVYTNAFLDNLVTSSDHFPYTVERLKGIVHRPTPERPWASWLASECWAAQVDENGWGLGVWHPGCVSFSGGFAGQRGKGGPKDSPTGYLAPNRVELLDYNGRHEYEYALILGTVEQIRGYTYNNTEKPTPPLWSFADDRQGWHCVNALDGGWPLSDGWMVSLDRRDPQLIGPTGFWKAEKAPTLYFEAAFFTKAKAAQVFWSTADKAGFHEGNSIQFPIEGDGKFRVHQIKLAEADGYKGAITGLRLDPAPGAPEDGWVRLRWIGFERADHSTVPGVVVNHSPAKSRQYLGSPSLAVLPDGEYVVSHDLFGPGTTKDRTLVFASADRGKTWKKRAEVIGQWWSSLFVHKGDLYLMGTSREYGHCVIRRSRDGGKTWTEPKDKDSGLLLADGKYHCAPVPVLIHKGRLWRAMEDAMGPGGWGSHFRSFMTSAPVDADLLKAESWTSSNRLGRDPEWLAGKFGGWLEGNAVATPEGQVVNVLRADYRAGPEKAAVIAISDDGKTATFDPKTGFLDFPGGCKKFTIRKDPKGEHYWALANYVPEKHKNANPERTRNTLALLRRDDAKGWEVRAVILYHPDTAKTGFQYADWQFDGDDLIAAVRTAHDDGLGGAHNQHDANYVTFHRIAKFRTLTTKE